MTPSEAIATMRAKHAPPPNVRRAERLAPRGKQQYAAYLETPAWKSRAGLVRKRAKGICEGCGMSRARDVHHLTYAHVGHEFLFELVALCGTCHERWHTK